MNKFNFQAMTKHGFLIIPKTLLQQQIENPHLQEGEIEALLKNPDESQLFGNAIQRPLQQELPVQKR